MSDVNIPLMHGHEQHLMILEMMTYKELCSYELTQ